MIHQEPNSIALNMMVARSSAATVAVPQPETISSDWRDLLPLLAGESITLRELQLSDAPTLFAMLSTEEVFALHLAAADQR